MPKYRDSFKASQGSKLKIVLRRYSPYEEYKMAVAPVKADTVEDLIQLGKRYQKYYWDKTIKRRRLHYDDRLLNLSYALPALRKLKNMVGLRNLKDKIVSQIVYILQGYADKEDILHTVLMGPPGAGKTTVAKILAEIYQSLRICRNHNVIVARRKDLIGKYCGHTAIKTTGVLDSARGGVLIIDEAYSLGNARKSDAFTKECIDTINEYLSLYNHDIIVIICGYEKELQESFFSYNPGLERRFPFKYKIAKYTAEELFEIFKCFCYKNNWTISVNDQNRVKKLFEPPDAFKFAGGTIQTIFTQAKIIHAKRMFTVNGHDTSFNYNDIQKAIKNHLDTSKTDKPYLSMYI